MSEIFGMKKIAGLCLTWVARTVFALIYGLVFFSADAVYNMIVFKRVAVDHTFFIIAVYYYLGAFFIFWAISAFSATVYRVLLGEENISKELAAWWEIYSVVLFFIGFRKFSGFSTAKTFVFISVILVVLLWGWSAALQRGFSTGPGEAVPFFLLGPDVG